VVNETQLDYGHSYSPYPELDMYNGGYVDGGDSYYASEGSPLGLEIHQANQRRFPLKAPYKPPPHQSTFLPNDIWNAIPKDVQAKICGWKLTQSSQNLNPHQDRVPST